MLINHTDEILKTKIVHDVFFKKRKDANAELREVVKILDLTELG